MDNAVKALYIAAAVIIGMIVISLGFLTMDEGRKAHNNSMNELTNYTATMEESKYVNYEGRTISGSQVLSLVSQWDDEIICVEIDNGTNTTQYIYTEASGALGGESSNKIADTKDKTNASQYINPNWKFECSLERDSYDAIYKVVFRRTR